ncbi:MAG: hypothetical protein PBV86_21225 [Delftia lacustris]|uniref:hypothetical protein n=1 Tax=Delftia TaxID=80865 RepID=UPI001314B873|nr:hypothetical protein [Delftia sp.]
MLNFIIKFVFALFKFVGRVCLIIFGLIFSAMGNAITSSFTEEEVNADADDHTTFVNDKYSAMQAFAAGDCDEFELAHFCAIDKK